MDIQLLKLLILKNTFFLNPNLSFQKNKLINIETLILILYTLYTLYNFIIQFLIIK
jgi:hypothetical protein